MTFSFPHQLRRIGIGCATLACSSLLQANPTPPESLLDDEHSRIELGVNEFTAPSIKKIFSDLQQLKKLPQLAEVRGDAKIPMDRARLALELGVLMANGFVAIQNNQMQLVKPLALQMSRYAKALGAGERVNRHAANILQNVEQRNIEKLKDDLAALQKDVEIELINLRDPDMAHLIGLGGWIRAIDVATQSLQTNFDAASFKLLIQPDVPEYFNEAIAGLDPTVTKRQDVAEIRRLLEQLEQIMRGIDAGKPDQQQLAQVRDIAEKLTRCALLKDFFGK